MLSQEDFRRAIESPFAKSTGWAATPFSTDSFAPQFAIGRIMFNGGTSIFRVDDETELGFSAPEAPGAPPRLTAKFFGDPMEPDLILEHNEVRIRSEAFDVQSVGADWSVRAAPGDVRLRLVMEPPHRILIQHLRLTFAEWTLSTTPDGGLQLERRNEVCLRLPRNPYVSGRCLVQCDSRTGQALLEGLTFEGNIAAVRPAGTRTRVLPGGALVWRFPVYVFANAQPDASIREVRLGTIAGTDNLGVFTNEKLARAAKRQEGFEVTRLRKDGFRRLLEEIAVPKGVRRLCIDPDPSAKTQEITLYGVEQAIADLGLEDEDVEHLIRESQQGAPNSEE